MIDDPKRALDFADAILQIVKERIEGRLHIEETGNGLANLAVCGAHID
jgi:hypothetical protein